MKKILLIEDDVFISDVYSTQFKKEGYKVDLAADCENGLKKIRENHPDLVALDIDFGSNKMNGLELLDILRSEKSTENTKVIIISNYNGKFISEKYGINVENLRVSKFFTKAETSIDQITSAIREILN